MPRHIEKCYYCDAEYEIIYESIDVNMIDDEEGENEDELGDYENGPKFCPFCGSDM